MIFRVLIVLCVVMVAGRTQSIQLGEERFNLVFAPPDSLNELREFLPPGATLEDWKTLVSLRRFSNFANPEAYIGALARTYRQRYPHMQFEGFRSANGDYGIDFLLPSENGLEWNAFRATSSVKGGVDVFQIAVRLHPAPADPAPIRELRGKYLALIARGDFPRETAVESAVEADAAAPSFLPDREGEAASPEAGPVKLLSPADAVAAAKKPPHRLTGVFEFQVKGGGQQNERIYLNSEADYRDPACLTIAIPPSLASALRKKFGDRPVQTLKGRRIQVLGTAERVTVWFYRDGRRTSDFYYQTHVNLADVDDIAVSEEL